MRVVVVAALVACSPQQASPPHGGVNSPHGNIKPPPTLMERGELSEALVPIAWWRGDWVAQPSGDSEHWTAAGGALYGVALQSTGSFEVMIVDDAGGPGKPDGVLRFYAMPGGKPAVEFREQSRTPRGIVFANPAHDFPKTISYSLDDKDGLNAEVAGDGNSEKFAYAYAPDPKPSAELEAADRALTTAGGITEWKLIASRVAGSVGYTIGTATYPASHAHPGRRSYATIWAKQPDGTWQVRFQAGRAINE